MSHLSVPKPPLRRPSRRVQHPLPQQGLTLIELLVAMAIGLLITMAAVSALTFTRQGHATVDASSQLEDNIRFTTDLIQRIGVQAGYMSASEAAKATPPDTADIDSNPAPNVSGFNNAKIHPTNPEHTLNSRLVSTDVGFGSDVLILRYQAEAKYPGSEDIDNSMIDCAGQSDFNVPQSRYERITSILYVDLVEGEPTLMCKSSRDKFQTPHSLVSGVENFQVLYGTRGVTSKEPPPPPPPPPAVTDTAADRYLRADEMVVAGDAAATNSNWRRVSSIRIGMVVRGPRNSQQGDEDQVFYPFGKALDSNGGPGRAITDPGLDKGTEFRMPDHNQPHDRRLRQTATFTIHLRNNNQDR
jgi:type IV pilus assembly protein PilW